MSKELDSLLELKNLGVYFIHSVVHAIVFIFVVITFVFHIKLGIWIIFIVFIVIV